MENDNDISLRIKKVFDDHKIRIYTKDEVKLDVIVGKGSYGVVYKAYIDELQVAVKCLEPILFVNPRKRNENEDAIGMK